MGGFFSLSLIKCTSY